MMFYLATLIPLAMLLCLLWLRWDWHKIGLASIALPVSLLFALLCYFIGKQQDVFAEIWNCRAVAVRYYQEWDERVPCRHPKYVTKTRTVSSTDSKGRVSTRVETYTVQEGYHHIYDVDNHPERWEAVSEYGDERSISQSSYREWEKLWGNSRFVDMRRNYHSRDGDMFQSDFPGDFDRICPLEDIHRYENRVRASSGVFNFPDVDEQTQQTYWRPADKGYTNAILSYDGTAFTPAEDMTLRRANAVLGPSHKVHIIVILWDGQRTASDEMQQVLGAWKGPNKNELIVAIGLGADRRAMWCQCYSWADDTAPHARIRQDVLDAGKFDAGKIKDILLHRIPEGWAKKDFDDFAYIDNPLPWWSYTLCVMLTIGSCAGSLGIAVKRH